MTVFKRVERYNSLCSAVPESATTAADVNGSATYAGLQSPALSAKPNATAGAIITADSKQNSYASLVSQPSRTPQRQSLFADVNVTSPGLGPVQGTLLASPVIAAGQTRDGPRAAAGGAGVAGPDGMKDHHISGSEPRYFPGVVTRSQRRNSMRKASVHEDDSPVGLGRPGTAGKKVVVRDGAE